MDRVLAIVLAIRYSPQPHSNMNVYAVVVLLCVVVAAGRVGRVEAAQLSVHFDIEPASLPEWSSNQQGIISQYLDLLENITVAKASLGFSVDTSIAYNFINVTRRGQTKLFYQWIVDAVNVPVMMMYRNYANGPNGILALTQPTIDYAKSKGKKAVAGVETGNESPAYITFYGTNTTYLESVLAQVKNVNSANAGFGGVAVHDYAGYQQLANTFTGTPISKALWEWDYKVATTNATRASYLAFAKQRGITTTYLESEYLVSKDTASLAAFWSMSKSDNMGLHLLFGDPSWARTENHAYVLSLVQKSVAFAQANP